MDLYILVIRRYYKSLLLFFFNFLNTNDMKVAVRLGTLVFVDMRKGRKFSISITILSHVLSVVLLFSENHKTGEENKFHLSLQVFCPHKC